ncbi:MAG: hypothetical protein KatS3mg119_0876 [Rhodothalassiaceae bacterium]|nr:MAG: hypothetical protein KatS3mg119_0876 [Rhodothalassiaceae bacterium]
MTRQLQRIAARLFRNAPRPAMVAGTLALVASLTPSAHAAPQEITEPAAPPGEPLEVLVYPRSLPENLARYEEATAGPLTPAEAPGAAAAALAVAGDFWHAGDLEGAVILLSEALDRLPPEDGSPPVALARASLHHALGEIFRTTAEFKRMNHAYLMAAETLRRAFGDEHPAVLKADTRAARGLLESATIRGRFQTAQAALSTRRDALLRLLRLEKRVREVLGANSSEYAIVRLTYALGLAMRGWSRKADQIVADLIEDHSAHMDATALAAAWIIRARIAAFFNNEERAARFAARAMAHVRETEAPVRVTDIADGEYERGSLGAGLRRIWSHRGTGDFNLTAPGAAAESLTGERDPWAGSVVELSLCIAPDGSVSTAEITGYKGSRDFARSMLEVVRHYRFAVPAARAAESCSPAALRLLAGAPTVQRGRRIVKNGGPLAVRPVDMLGDAPFRDGYLAWLDSGADGR